MFQIKDGKVTVDGNTIRASKVKVRFSLDKPIEVEISGFSSGIEIEGIGTLMHHKSMDTIKENFPVSLSVPFFEQDLKNPLSTIQIPMGDAMKVTFEGQEDYIIEYVAFEMEPFYELCPNIKIIVIPKKS